MVVGLALSFEVLPWFLAGAVLLGLAGWLLKLDPGKPVHQAFVVFLAARGVLALSDGLFHNRAPVAPGGLLDLATDAANWMVPALHIAIPFVAIHFALVYRATYVHKAERSMPSPWPPAGLALFLALYIVFPGLWRDASGLGPLFIFTGLTYLSYALVSLLLVWEWTRAEPGPMRRAFLLVAFGFALSPLHVAVFEVLVVDLGVGALGTGGLSLGQLGPIFLASHLAVDLSLIPLALVVLLVLRQLALEPEDPSRPLIVRGLAALGLPVLTGVIGATAAVGVSVGGGLTTANLFEAMWDVAFPAVVAYALLRHRLFDLDFKLRRAVRQGSVAGTIGAGFVVLSEAMELLLPFESEALGFLAAALLGFTLQPIQSFAERTTRTLLPGVRPLDEMGFEDQVDLYREQVEIAWADGTLSDKDRRMLDNVRDRLGLPEQVAARVESETRAKADAQPA